MRVGSGWRSLSRRSAWAVVPGWGLTLYIILFIQISGMRDTSCGIIHGNPNKGYFPVSLFSVGETRQSGSPIGSVNEFPSFLKLLRSQVVVGPCASSRVTDMRNRLCDIKWSERTFVHRDDGHGLLVALVRRPVSDSGVAVNHFGEGAKY